VTPEEELSHILRPAGGGLYLVSTGRDEQLALQRKLYDAPTDAHVDQKWRDALARIKSARACVLGIPSDVGAGFRRGANMGPQAIRTRMLTEDPGYPDYASDHGILDIGDVFCVPQLLADDMLSEQQKSRARAALYPTLTESARDALPVSPLSIAERAWDLVFKLNPDVKAVTLGGDHSTAWPVVAALGKRERERAGKTYEAQEFAACATPPFAIVQMDAHTDLLQERLGITMCFATWSYHANELLGRQGRLTEVGIRATRKDRGAWEGDLGVRQFWAEECNRDEARAIDAIVAHVKSTGAKGVYFSNDIDGTDAAFADATGTPEPFGLRPDFVVELIRRLGKELVILGADVMEVAPPLRDDPTTTVSLAVRYLRESLTAMRL
jgi:agmatinase